MRRNTLPTDFYASRPRSAPPQTGSLQGPKKSSSAPNTPQEESLLSETATTIHTKPSLIGKGNVTGPIKQPMSNGHHKSSAASETKHEKLKPLAPAPKADTNGNTAKETKAILPTETQKKELTETHIKDETTEVLSFIPKKDKPFTMSASAKSGASNPNLVEKKLEITKDQKLPNVILHYSNPKKPLFKSMQFMILEDPNSPLKDQPKFNHVQYGYDGTRFKHFEDAPKASNSEVKDATVVIPLCYWKNPKTGKEVAAIARSYITSGAAKVYVYLGRASDPDFQTPIGEIEAVGKGKKEDWLAHHSKKLLSPQDPILKGKIEIIDRKDWICSEAYKEATTNFSVETANSSSPLNELIQRDVSDIVNPQQKSSPSTRRGAGSTRAILEQQQLRSPAKVPAKQEVRDEKVPAKHDVRDQLLLHLLPAAIKNRDLSDKQAAQDVGSEIAETAATIYDTFQRKFDARIKATLFAARSNSPTSPSCAAEALIQPPTHISPRRRANS